MAVSDEETFFSEYSHRTHHSVFDNNHRQTLAASHKTNGERCEDAKIYFKIFYSLDVCSTISVSMSSSPISVAATISRQTLQNNNKMKQNEIRMRKREKEGGREREMNGRNA